MSYIDPAQQIACKKCNEAIWKLYQAHGQVSRAQCINCKHVVDIDQSEKQVQTEADPKTYDLRMFI